MSGSDDFLLKPRKMAAILVGLIAIVLIGLSVLFPKSPIPIDRVNGQYANGKCGLVTFHDGVARWDKSQAVYTLETDKVGLFALTNYFVGVTSQGTKCSVVSDRQQHPLYLRFDKEEHPATVSLWERGQPATFKFVRQRDQPNGG